jgi:hypothetical protein
LSIASFRRASSARAWIGAAHQLDGSGCMIVLPQMHRVQKAHFIGVLGKIWKEV